jgi:tetratricopeptide (TPR) repeat protein
VKIVLQCVAAALLATGVAAQTQETSHVDRVGGPLARFRRVERDATAALEKNPADSRALGERGLARLRLGRTAEGVLDLRRAAELDPQSAEIATNLSFGLWLQGHIPEALASAQRAVSLKPGIGAAQYYVGRLLLLTGGDRNAAIQHLERAVELTPEDVDMRFELMSAYRRRGDTVAAAAQLRILSGSRPIGDPAVTYAEGLLAGDRGQLEVAIEKFRQAVRANPRLIAARFDLGIALVRKNRWKEAAELFGELAKERPDSYEAAYFHALSLQNEQRLEEAAPEVRRALLLDPNSANAQTLQGIVLSGLGDYSGAVAALERGTQLDAANFDAWFYLGRAQYALRDLSAAERALRAAVARQPEHFDARFFLATVLEALGQRNAAQAEYRHLTAKWPQDARGFVGLGNLLERAGQTEEAVTVLQRARELAPQDFEALLSLGRALSRRQQWPEATRLLREAVQRMPQNAEARYQLALALQRQGLREEAAREFAEVERLNREFRKGSGMATMPPSPVKPE